MSRKMKLVFTISIMLNVLLLGVLAGGIYKRISDSPFKGENGRPLLDHKIAAEMMRARKDHEDLHKAMKEARSHMLGTLSAAEFNEEDFLAASLKMDEAQTALFAARAQTAAKIAKDLSPEDRKELAKHLRLVPFHHGRKGMSGKDAGEKKVKDLMPPPPPKE